MSGEIVVCTECETRNRLPENWAGAPRCARCKNLLPVPARSAPRDTRATAVYRNRTEVKPGPGKSRFRSKSIVMVLATAVLGLGFFASFISYTRRTFPSVSMDPPTDCQQGQDSELVIAGCTAWLAQGINDPLAISDAYLFRGRAHAGLDQLVQAREDYNLAIQTLPNYPFAFEERGQLNEYEHRYEAAFSDTAAALTHINTLLQAYPAHQPYLDTKKRLEPKLVYRQRRLDLEIHWRNYLETIQQQGDHSNWSGPPADLYWSHHEK